MTTNALSKSGVGVWDRSTHPAHSHDHSVKIMILKEQLRFEFLCNADELSPCRVLCASGCDSWGVDHSTTTGHVMEPCDRCLFVEWMDALSQTSFYLGDCLMTGSARILFEGAIKIGYSDGYVWTFIDEKKDGAT